MSGFADASITNAMPDIPRLFTAICEWLATMTYIMVVYRRATWRRTATAGAAGLVAIIAVQYLSGAMPLWFWMVGMLLAFGCMWAVIWLGAGTGKREGLYLAARAFVLAELVASLHWQLTTFLE